MRISFFQLKKNTDWKVAYTDTVSMTHEAVTYDRKYAKYRMRTDGLKVFSRKMGNRIYLELLAQKLGQTESTENRLSCPCWQKTKAEAIRG